MSFIYDIPTDTIVDAEDGGLIATPAETVDPDDSLKMAAALELFDALGAIVYAWQIGELALPDALSVPACQALHKGSPPTYRDQMVRAAEHQMRGEP